MVAASLQKYLKERDKNKVEVSSWAVDSDKPGIANCKHCNAPVSYKSGKKALLNHSETQKHINNTPKNSGARQITLNECLHAASEQEKEEKELDERTKEFEISIARSLSNHNITMEFAECLQAQLKKYCGDSAVVEHMKLGQRKAEVLVRQGVAPAYREETIALLQNCYAFSVGFDESEINKTSEMEIMVRIATQENKIELRHYRTLDLYSATAKNIVDDLLSTFDEDGIDYKSKLLSSMTDGCNTMEGHLNGVKKLMMEKIPELMNPGSCTDHHLSNAMKHAVNAFDPDIERALVNIYMDVGGAPGRGLKRKKHFEKICLDMGIAPIPIKKFCTTRFRAVRTCLKPVIHNWNGIVKYYEQLKKPTPRQVLLRDYFVTREMMSYMNMNFVYSATREMDEAIDHFEKRQTLIFDAREKMEKILRSSILKLHKEGSVKRVNDEEIVVKKTGSELLEFDIDNVKTKLAKRSIFVGEECKNFMKQLSLEPKSPQLNKFYEKVEMFHRTVVIKYQHYFKTALKCTELDYVSAFNPLKHNHMATSPYLKYLAKKFTKIVKNIEPCEGLDRINEEIESYTTDDEVTLFANLEFEEFWVKVSTLTENGWPKYQILPSFALSFGTIFNSNSEAERAFSVQTAIHQNPKRNQMMQETFDGHMQVRYGVEGRESKELCRVCIDHKNSGRTTKSKHHCHCAIAPVDEKMVANCNRMWSAEEARRKLQKVDVKENEVKKAASDEDFTKRTLKFVTGLKVRNTFYPSDLMGPIFVVDDSELEEERKKKKGSSSASSTSTKKKDKASDDAASSTSTKKKDKASDDAASSTSTKKKDKASDDAASSTATSKHNSRKRKADQSGDVEIPVKQVPISLFKK